MSKSEFLQIFEKNLINISEEEKQDAVAYYTEYFEEAGSENEAKVIEELGSPVMLARKISAEAAIKDIEAGYAGKSSSGAYTYDNVSRGGTKEYKKSRDGKGFWSNIGVILLLLCSSPVILPIGIVLAVVAFVLVLVVGIVLLAFVIAGVALTFGGIVGVIGGILGIFTHMFSGLMAVGIGMIIIGVGMLVFIAGKALAKCVTSLIVALGRRKTSRM